MGLITKEVEIELYGHHIKQFRDKGYKIPTIKHKWGSTVPKGTKLLVKVSDLKPSSTVYVDVQCDYCGDILRRKFYQYTHGNHDGKFYCKNCSSKAQLSGHNSPVWNFNKSDEDREIGRNYPEYNEFIRKVLLRDNYTCLVCGKKHENIEVHHLNGYNWCKDGRTDETNAVTLCHNCHANFHSIYGRGNNTKKQFDEWLGYVLVQPIKCHNELIKTKRVYCIENNTVYNSVEEAGKSINVSSSSIYTMCSRRKYFTKQGNYELCLKSIKGKHFLWYDDYIVMSKSQINDFLEQCKNQHKKKIICLNTGEVFNTLKEAAQHYNITSSSDILYCCKGKSLSAGKSTDGTKLRWKYYDDYIKENYCAC